MKALTNDNGGEYCSKEIEAFYQYWGIARLEEYSTWSRAKNWHGKRPNRTCIKKPRSMRADASFSKGFWAEAIATTNYLTSMSPSSILGDMTP